MANLTFLDLMFAEALASGLAREARIAERPPPDNFFTLPRDPDGWRKIRDASKKENMVVCIEFTDNSNDNCKRVQGLFMDLAREFDGIPFVRVVIGLGATYSDMRSDLGGVQYTPTILMVFYGDDSVQRAKFEGIGEIADAQSSGRLKGVIKELIDRRVKLKMAERLAEGLAQRVRSQLSDRERRLREEYETKLERQMKEKEEEFQKKEEERKRKEEQEKDQKVRLANEKLRQQRAEHLEELLEMNLDSSSNKELKVIMEKMVISYVGCLSKDDLKERLMENVPELRIRKSGYRSKSNSGNYEGDPLGAMSIDDMGKLSKKLEEMTARANTAENSLRPLKKEIESLKDKVADLTQKNKTLRNNSSRVVASSDKSTKVEELETSLKETRMLYTTSLQDFDIMGVIHSSEDDKDCDSLILRTKCNKPGIPNKDRVYAMKVLTDFFIEKTQTKVRQDNQNEYQVLCQLSPHENIIHMWAFFYDRLTRREYKFFKKAGSNARSMSLFILMDEHPTSMAEQLKSLVENRGPLSTKVLSWLKDLLSGLVFLELHHVVHRDLKLSNLLLASTGKVIISDFGKAIAMEDGFAIKHTSGFDIGGNRAHLAPEILNSKPGPRNFLDYTKQPVWATGVLAYELAGHQSPFASGMIDQRGYGVDQLLPLKSTYCKNPSYCAKLPEGVTRLVQSMLEPEPEERHSLQQCLDKVNNI